PPPPVSSARSTSPLGTSHRSSAYPTTACCGTTTCRYPGRKAPPRRHCNLRWPARPEIPMNLYAKLCERAAQDRPLRIGLIGAGKFGSMYLAQVPKTPGVHLVGIADLAPASARTNLQRVGWLAERSAAPSLEAALASGATHVNDDWQALVAHPQVDIIVEATGNPMAAVEHALAAFQHGKHVVMVAVGADAFCGPLLARRA